MALVRPLCERTALRAEDQYLLCDWGWRRATLAPALVLPPGGGPHLLQPLMQAQRRKLGNLFAEARAPTPHGRLAEAHRTVAPRARTVNASPANADG